MELNFSKKFDDKLKTDVYSFEHIINCSVRADKNAANIAIDAKKNKNTKDEGDSSDKDDDPVVDEILKDADNAKWSTEEKDNLPDSSFAVIEKGYEDGKSPKTARHLPYKDADGKINIPHLKDAWDRRDQIESVLHTESDQELRDKAEKVLEGPYKKYVTHGKEPDAAEDKKESKKPAKQNNSKTVDNTTITTNSVSTGAPVRQTWRLISAVSAWPQSGFDYPQLVDYSYENGAFLKPAINMINKGKPDLIWNHSDDAHDVAGFVENASWENSTDIPNGINGDLVVDPAYDSKAALGLEKGYIRNGSIGVQMDCRPSHPKMKFEIFVKSQGKEVDGELVRWLPVRISNVRHMALVPSGTGADPNAGRRMQNTSDNPGEKTIQNKKVKKQKGEIMEQWIALLSGLAKGLGVEVAIAEGAELPDGLEDRLNKKIENFKALNEKYNVLCASVEKLGELVCDGVAPATFAETFQAVENKIALSAHGEKVLDLYRKDAVKWFDSAKAAREKPDLSDTEKRMRGRIAKSTDLDYLEDMVAEYKAITETNLSNKRVSQGAEIPKVETKPLDDRMMTDIEASVKDIWRVKSASATK